MRTTREKSTKAARHAAKKTAKKTAKTDAKGTRTEDTERFVRDLQVRGEAVKPTAAGKLPLEATHAITQDEEGTVKIKRARFKIF